MSSNLSSSTSVHFPSKQCAWGKFITIPREIYVCFPFLILFWELLVLYRVSYEAMLLIRLPFGPPEHCLSIPSDNGIKEQWGHNWDSRRDQ